MEKQFRNRYSAIGAAELAPLVPGSSTLGLAWEGRFEIDMGRTPRWIKLALLGVVVAVFASLALWRSRPGFTPRPARIASALLPEPVALAPGVYLLGQCAPAAVYLVETSQGLVLIDSGLEARATAVRQQIRQLGFDITQLRAILLTHVHADHSLGAESLRQLTGAPVYAGQGDDEPLRAGGPREAFFGITDVPDVKAHPTTVDVQLKGGETLPFGETQLTALATPGHTTGSTCYLLKRPDLSALFTGDVVQHLSPASQGALGTYTAYLPPRYRGDVRDSLATLRRLRELPRPDLVLPGHPRMDPTPQNPHLSDADWQSLLDTGIAEMKQLLARYDADGADFLDGAPKELLPGLHYLGDCGPTPVYCLATSEHLLLFDAPGGPALVDWLNRRFAALGWKDRKPTAVLLTSAGEEATAGLPSLLRQHRCPVVATPEGLTRVRRQCPRETRLVSVAELDRTGWFPGRTIIVSGLDDSAVAYLLRWQGKTVLVSGRVPVKLTEATDKWMWQQLTAAGGSLEKFRATMDRLAGVKPDLWLTAVPVYGQNANLYDDDWPNVLRQIRQSIASAP